MQVHKKKPVNLVFRGQLCPLLCHFGAAIREKLHKNRWNDPSKRNFPRDWDEQLSGRCSIFFILCKIAEESRMKSRTIDQCEKLYFWRLNLEIPFEVNSNRFRQIYVFSNLSFIVQNFYFILSRYEMYIDIIRGIWIVFFFLFYFIVDILQGTNWDKINLDLKRICIVFFLSGITIQLR